MQLQTMDHRTCHRTRFQVAATLLLSGLAALSAPVNAQVTYSVLPITDPIDPMSYHPRPTALANPSGERFQLMGPPRVHRGERPVIEPQGPFVFMQHVACPSRLDGGGPVVKSEMAEQEHAEFGDSAVASEVPELYDVLKHFATAQQNSSWDDATAVDVSWLAQVAAQRDVAGSAQANAWLHALGHELPEEIIILPEEGPKNMGTPRNKPAIDWETGIALEVFPNPSTGPTHVMYEVPEGIEKAELRVVDLHGREQQRVRLGEGPGLLTMTMAGLAPGVYLLELRGAGQTLAWTKMILQR